MYALPSPAGTEATDEAAPAPVPGSTSATKSTTKSSARTVHGDPISFKYGVVQVDVVLTGSTITDIKTLQAPGGGYQSYTDRAVPTMKQRIIAAQSTSVAAATGATYTSKGYADSVQSALNRA